MTVETVESAEAPLPTLAVTTPVELDAGPGPGGRIGMVALATDAVSELDVARLLPAGEVALYVNRVENANTVTLESLAAMAHDLGRAAAGILPGVPLDAMIYGCTSGTIAIGEDTVFAKLREVRPGIPCTTPMTAGIAGCEKLGCHSMALITPYTDDINQMMKEFIEARGVSVPVIGTFNLADDDRVARISTASVRDAVLELGAEDVDSVFVSCSSLRVTPIIEECEAKLDKPVMSSDQALAWHSLRLAGYDDAIPGFGRLLMI